MLNSDTIAKYAKQDTAPTSSTTAASSNSGRRPKGKGISSSPQVLTDYLAKHNVKVVRTDAGKDGATVLILDGCPMNQDHGRNGDTAVVLRANGQIGFACKHNSCEKHTWADVRRAIDPEHATHHHKDGAYLPYEATEIGLCRRKQTQDGEVLAPLTNFTAMIAAQVAQDDGVETRRLFEIEAHLGGRSYRFAIPASQFAAMNWPVEQMGAGAIVHAGQGNKDHARAAIQMLSEDIIERTIFTHTGWREVGGRWMYLHTGGAIGPDGPVSGIEVALEGTLSHYTLPHTSDKPELVAAVQASMRMLKIVPDLIGLPLYCATWRAALESAEFAMHLAGATGEGKSELAALCQQHYGSAMAAKSLPASWSSTGNALEALAFAAKDTLLTVDDFAPGGTPADIQRFHREADRILRAQGNRAGRLRLRADASLRSAKPPRGMILSTGEDVPRGHSVRARCLIMEIERGAMRWELLTDCQRDAAAGVYAIAMAGFIGWVAKRGYKAVLADFHTNVRRLRDEATQATQHRRTPEIVGNLAAGFEVFLVFAEELGAIGESEHGDLWERAWTALGDAAEAQAGHHAAADPVLRFLTLLASAIGAGHAHVASPDGTIPPTPDGWGWRLRVIGSQSTREDWQPQGDRVGWIEGEDLYLDPDAAYRIAQAMTGASGDGIPVTGRTLIKRLHERGLLVTVDGGRGRLTIRHQLENQRRAVLHLHRDTLMSSEPAQPSQAAQDIPGEG